MLQIHSHRARHYLDSLKHENSGARRSRGVATVRAVPVTRRKMSAREDSRRPVLLAVDALKPDAAFIDDDYANPLQLELREELRAAGFRC